MLLPVKHRGKRTKDRSERMLSIRPPLGPRGRGGRALRGVTGTTRTSVPPPETAASHKNSLEEEPKSSPSLVWLYLSS